MITFLSIRTLVYIWSGTFVYLNISFFIKTLFYLHFNILVKSPVIHCSISFSLVCCLRPLPLPFYLILDDFLPKTRIIASEFDKIDNFTSTMFIFLSKVLCWFVRFFFYQLLYSCVPDWNFLILNVVLRQNATVHRYVQDNFCPHIDLFWLFLCETGFTLAIFPRNVILVLSQKLVRSFWLGFLQGVRYFFTFHPYSNINISHHQPFSLLSWLNTFFFK